MLHIILLILKIIGFLILGILALILLLTAVILLAPFAYRLDFSIDNSLESAKGRIRFHWLMRLISGEVRYEGGSFDWHMRAAWKKFGDETDGADGKDADATVAADNAHISEQDDRAGKAASEKAAVGVAEEVSQEEAAKEAENTLEKPAHKADSPLKSGPDPDIRSITAGKNTSKSRTDRTERKKNIRYL